MANTLSRVLKHARLLLALAMLPSSGLAHRLDEYLQATLVSVEPTEVRLQINLTPGVAVARSVLSRIDRNHDGAISTNEAVAYAEQLKHDLAIQLDQHKVTLKVVRAEFPAIGDLWTGWGIIQLEFSATLNPQAPGAHTLTVANRHLPDISVYLLNAAKPKADFIRISSQERNKDQSSGEIHFEVKIGHIPVDWDRKLQNPTPKIQGNFKTQTSIGGVVIEFPKFEI